MKSQLRLFKPLSVAPYIDLMGKSFGSWTVLRRAPLDGSVNRGARWICQCICGKTRIIRSDGLRRNTGSCGCARRKSDMPIQSLYGNYIRTAKSKGLSFDLSFHDFKGLLAGACHYCGLVESNLFKNLRHHFRYNGIDRKDNGIGYTPSNCVSCCELCNWMKRDLKVPVFLESIRRIYLHTEAKNAVPKHRSSAELCPEIQEIPVASRIQ